MMLVAATVFQSNSTHYPLVAVNSQYVSISLLKYFASLSEESMLTSH